MSKIEYLTNTEELMMKCIWNYGKEMPFLRMGEELKDKFHKEYKRTSIRTYLFRLEDKGYINRLYDKKDRRVTYIDLTQKGIDLLDKHNDIMINYTNSMISRLGEEDTKTLVNLLNRLCDIIEDLNEN